MSASQRCWNSTGSQGDRSCAQLVQHLHCRNCPVYRAAGQELLHRELSTSDPLPSLSASLSAIESTPDRGARQPHLIFKAALEYFALAASQLLAVSAFQKAHALPRNHSTALLGLVPWNGRVIPCIDFAALLTPSLKSAAAASASGRLIVLKSSHGPIALSVEQALQVTTLSEEQAIGAHGCALIDALLPWNDLHVSRVSSTVLAQSIGATLCT